MKVVVSGIPRGYQAPLPGGFWLTEEHRKKIEGVEVLLAEGGNRVHYGEELDWEDYQKVPVSIGG